MDIKQAGRLKNRDRGNASVSTAIKHQNKTKKDSEVIVHLGHRQLNVLQLNCVLVGALLVVDGRMELHDDDMDRF